jgi:hypothetical protein
MQPGLWYLGVKYDARGPFDSHCQETYSKYLMLSQDQSQVAYFSMQPEGTPGRYWFTFDDGPYKDYTLCYSGGYLYATSDVARLGADFGTDDTGETLKLWSIQGDTKYWFKIGGGYQSHDCGQYWYIESTTDASQACVFRIRDV